MYEPALLAVLALAGAWTKADSWLLTGSLLSAIVALLLLAVPPLPGRIQPPRWILPVSLWLTLGLAMGWDRGQGISELALAALVLATITAASRHAPGDRHVLFLAGGVALLSIWALWQSVVGFHMAHGELASLPEGVRNAVQFRLDSGRAFASQLHPGHLGVLLATVVPLAGAGITGRKYRTPWILVLILASLGVVLTRSPLALGLAVAGLLATLGPHHGGRLWAVAAAVSLILLVVVVSLRPDLLELHPIVWRLENWHNAAWVWANAPITGVGLGGFGQAALMVPFPVPNHPLHAHNLPLEWLAEMGLPGLLFAGVLFGWILDLARRLWPRRRGLAAALLIIPLHNLADFSLFQPGVAVLWAVVAGWALALAPRRGNHPVPEARSWPAVLAASSAAVFFGLSLASTVMLHRATSLDLTSRVDAEVAAFQLAPWQPLPTPLAQAILVARGAETTTLERAVERARWWRPHSASLARAASLLEARTGDLPTSSADAWAAEAFTALDRRTAAPGPGGAAP